MQEADYFEENSNGEQQLAADDDTAVEVQNDGVRLSVDVVSQTGSSEVYTYNSDEGYYRISSDDNPKLATKLDGLFRALSREFGPGQITRNPSDSYELVVKREQVSPQEESSSVTSRTSGEYVLSPTTNHDVLLVIDEVLTELTN